MPKSIGLAASRNTNGLLRVNAIAANGPAVSAAIAATSEIPIVFVGGGDPVQRGPVASFNRPGGNITGVVQFGGALGMKRVELLRRFIPEATEFVLLLNPNNPNAERVTADVLSAAQRLRAQARVLRASTQSELEATFGTLSGRRFIALLVSADPFFLSRRELIARLAASSGVPAMYDFREYVAAGGLISYGASLTEAYRQVGSYVGRILGGESPADLPVLQATKFELIINIRTAKELSLDVPDQFLALADEVIE